ncbi:potassium channel family protein [Halorhabdus sp. BNX81]|uniref:potassium channel family protein n=1 Tax=Halorhabdus sp. BNX81 TaxID=2980181 RepID=UPI0023DD4A5C|nr:potassium channel family protein [Halorhabdus sp. BNX81]WEL20183.1 PhoU-like domain fused to TrkA-C domain [Halorhabdus sp. BNX81]
MASGEDVTYEPVSVKDVLAEMKDTAELLIDLSYSAVLLGSDEIAEEVLALEERMDVLHLQARMSLLMAARNPEDAEALAPVLGVVGAAEKISDAAGDIAKVVLEDIGLPAAMRATLPEAVETLVRATVAADSTYADRTLGDLNLETATGVRIIAIRRSGEWLMNPTAETTLQSGDVLLARGPEEGIAEVYAATTGGTYEPPAPPESDIEDLERAVDSIVLMKNMSELAVDLAYGAVLFDSEAVAEEVLELEAEVDALQSRFEAWTLQAAGRVDDPIALRGLVHLARSTEVISDAALEISEGVLRGLGTHPVVEAAIEASDEVIVRETVAAGSDLDGATLGDLEVKTRTGMRVIAVRRPATHPTGKHSTDWELSPGPATTIEAGDVLIAKGTRSGAERLGELAGGE